MRSSAFTTTIYGSVLAPVLLAALITPHAPRSVPSPAAFVEAMEGSVRVSSLESYQVLESASFPEVLEVSEVLQAFLATSKSGAYLDPVRDALWGAYPGLVNESVLPAGYTYEWDGERWVLICSIKAVFELDFGTLGGVRVDVEDKIILY